ncbi:MAG: hypothetical protein U0457_00420 [Candidatus Sericytochromatia bacterium]
MKKIALAFFLTLTFSLSSFSASLQDANKLFKEGKTDEAIKMLQEIVKAEPENLDAYSLLSKIYESRLEIDKALEVNQLYQKYKFLKKKAPVIQSTPTPEATPESTSAPTEEKEEFELIPIDNDFYMNIFSKRDETKEVGNKKYYDLKKIKSVLNNLPLSTDELDDTKKKLDFKSKFGLTTYDDLLILEKINLSLIQIKMDVKKYEILNEKDEAKIKEKKLEAKELVNQYNKELKSFEEVLNTPVYPNTDQTTYDYFRYSESVPERHLQGMDAFKKSILDGILENDKELTNLKATIIESTERISELKEILSDEILKAKESSLTQADKNNVAKYHEYTKKIVDSKARIYEIITMEQDVLYKAYENIKKTISQIKPDYEFKDDKLPPQPKIEEVKKEEPVKK